MKRFCATISRVLAAAAIAATLTVAASAQTETILHSFTGGNDGGSPQGALIFDSKGNLYGTTSGGGQSSSCGGCGAAFELVNSNGTWSENILYSFGSLSNLNDGANPNGPLTFDSKGNLYGTTISGGSSFQGTVFELVAGSNGIWTEKVLYNFTGGIDGGFPYGSGVTFDAAGNLYGMTESGGAYGFGTVFELVAGANGTWTEKVLHSFTSTNDGSLPFGSTLSIDAAGSLYGVTTGGGSHDYGVVFKLVPGSNGTWTEKVLYSFPGGTGGSFPAGNLVFDASGNLYGEAGFVVYKLTPSSSGAWTETTLHTFGGGSDGANLYAGLAFDKAGNLYGTTNAGGTHRGTVFELTPESNGTWSEKVLHRFSPNGGDGVFPNFGNLTIDASGAVYGVTPQGGQSKSGVVFKIVP
jgi:uncharacterized repeat protein (TIGR03803 family)